jgi:cytochrome c553
MSQVARSSARRIAMAVCVVVAAAAGGLLAWPAAGRAATPQAQLVQQGRDFALEACGACHQVGPRDPVPAPVDAGQGTKVRAPSFAAIASDKRKDATYLRSIIRQPHYPIKEQEIGTERSRRGRRLPAIAEASALNEPAPQSGRAGRVIRTAMPDRSRAAR